MPIIVNSDVMMAKRKISLNELSEIVDLTLSNLSILKTGKAKAIRFTTLEAICSALECQPGEIWNLKKMRTSNAPLKRIMSKLFPPFLLKKRDGFTPPMLDLPPS